MTFEKLKSAITTKNVLIVAGIGAVAGLAFYFGKDKIKFGSAAATTAATSAAETVAETVADVTVESATAAI